MQVTQPITEARPLAWTTPDGRFTIAVTRTVEAYAVTVENAAGFRIDALARTFATESDARDLAHRIATMLRDGATVEQVVDAIQPAADVIAAAEALCLQAAIPAPRLAPAAKGTTQRVSDPGHRVLAVAATTGRILRGRIDDGRAPITVINALARRGYLRRVDVKQGLRTVTIGAEITDKGRRRLVELDATNRNPIAA